MSQPPAAAAAGTRGRGLPVLPMALMAGLFLFAADSMLGQIGRNGYLALMDSVLDDPEPRLLPGTERTVIRRFVGVPSVDRFLATANVFFGCAVDGSRPELSLFTFYFGTQLLPFFLVFMIESQRTVKGSVVLFNPVVWGLAMQLLGFGALTPLLLLLHLGVTSRSSLADAVRLRDHTALHAVVPAFLLGYVLLGGLMAYPFPVDGLRQWSAAIWQAYPLHVVVCQTVFAGVVKRLSIGEGAFKPRAQLDRAALSHAYGFAWNFAVMGQLLTFAALVTSTLFPGLYPAGVARSLSLSNVFVPGPFHSAEPMASPAAAVHDFLRYDLYSGSAALLIWAVHLLLEVRPVSSSEDRGNLARGIMTSVLLSGPAGAVVALLQHRDETVLAAELKAVKQN